VALVSFADTSVLSRAYAAKTRSYVDPNQEMIGLGAANLAAGLLQGIPISSSSSRTPVAEASGARTQLTGVVGAVAVALLLVLAPDLLKNLPNAALAAVVIASAIGLFEIADLRRIFRIQRWEFWLSMVCFVGVATLGAIPGIGLAIVIAVVEFLWDGWRPHYAVLGRVDGIRGFHDVKRYPEARLVPGLVLFRWDAPLFFANAELFRERVREAIEGSPTPVRRIVVLAEPVTSIDVTSADVLAELRETLCASRIELHFAEMKDPVKDKVRRFELLDQLGAEIFHPTVGAAVDAYLEDHPTDWTPSDRLRPKGVSPSLRWPRELERPGRRVSGLEAVLEEQRTGQRAGGVERGGPDVEAVRPHGTRVDPGENRAAAISGGDGDGALTAAVETGWPPTVQSALPSVSSRCA
jgi:MFS superfamily sulfate permease-like transporter